MHPSQSRGAKSPHFSPVIAVVGRRVKLSPTKRRDHGGILSSDHCSATWGQAAVVTQSTVVEKCDACDCQVWTGRSLVDWTTASQQSCRRKIF
eukprot:scaffold7557_cov68-Cyclotella_meneghiniana.AAC.3